MNKEVEFKSNHEKYFSWWLDELMEVGIIDNYDYEPTSYELSDKVVYQVLDNKGKQKNKTLLEEHCYTPDFIINWNNNKLNVANKIGILYDNKCESVIEIKPPFNMNNMTRLFIINQKWVYEKYKIYVQKVVVDDIFSKTFIPKRYLKTDKSNKLRKINYKHMLIDKYIVDVELL